MKALEQSFLEKSGWGDGPWQHEPDKVQWQDADTDLPCLIVRGYTSGALCGYVGVHKTHSCFGKDYEDVDAKLQVHGGITFSSKCNPNGKICHTVEDGEDDNVWWFGFDCSHAYDLSPKREARLYKLTVCEIEVDLKELADHPLIRVDYRDLDYVKAEVASLAKQLAAIA